MEGNSLTWTMLIPRTTVRSRLWPWRRSSLPGS